MIGMCFYNQKRFTCGDWSWTSFAHQCNYEYRTGETCGMKLVNLTEYAAMQCRLCEKIETKHRRRSAELERVHRWKREGNTLVASIEKSQDTIKTLDREIVKLQKEREEKSRALWSGRAQFNCVGVHCWRAGVSEFNFFPSTPFPLFFFFLCFCCFLFLAIFPPAASFIMSVVLRHVSP